MAHLDGEVTSGSPDQAHVELSQGVDPEVVAGTVVAVGELVNIVQPAVTTSVAVVVEAYA